MTSGKDKIRLTRPSNHATENNLEFVKTSFSSHVVLGNNIQMFRGKNAVNREKFIFQTQTCKKVQFITRSNQHIKCQEQKFNLIYQHKIHGRISGKQGTYSKNVKGYGTPVKNVYCPSSIFQIFLRFQPEKTTN